MADKQNSRFEIEIERQRRVKAEDTLMSMKLFLFDYFHRLGPEPALNIDIIVETACKALNSDVDTEKRTYSQIEIDILEAFSKAVTLEEERKLSQDRLAKSNEKLFKKNKELEEALLKVKTLSGMLPICASCKRIRDDKGYWNQIENYIREHSEAEFSHGMCQECAKKLYSDLLDENGNF